MLYIKKMKLRNIFDLAMSCNLNLDYLSAFILITKNKSYFLCIVATARGLGCEGEGDAGEAHGKACDRG